MSRKPQDGLPPDFPRESLKGSGDEGYQPSAMGTTSTQLMLATKQGDRAAFDRLVEHIRGRAFHTARMLVGSRDDAMDLTQEAFMKVFRARDTFRDGEPFLYGATERDGSERSSPGARLKAVFFLQQSTLNQTVPVSPDAAALELVARILPVSGI